MDFVFRIMQLVLALAALSVFASLDLNPEQQKCPSDDGIIASLIAFMIVSNLSTKTQ